MMAKKPFYSLEEVCEKLGKSEDDVKALVREGELREFRDAGKVFFKSEDIDRMAGDTAPTDDEEIMLEAGSDSDSDEDSESPAKLTESSGGTSIIGLEPLDGESSESEDSGTGGEEKEEKEDTMITASGIGVFDDDELEIDADPMAKTQITTGADEDDQITLEGAGSGSGLLDLAREADDTALGADLLDEIIPGEDEPSEEEPVAEAEPVEEAEPAEEEPEAEAEEEALPEEAEAGEPVVAAPPAAPRTAADPAEGMFSGMLVGALVLVAAGLIVVSGSLQGAVPEFAKLLSNGSTFYITLGGAALVIVLALLAGWFIGKAFAPRPRRA